MNPGLALDFIDAREPERFLSRQGIAQFVESLSFGQATLHPDVIAHGAERGDVKYAVAMQYNAGWGEALRSYVNCAETKGGGAHVTGFLTACERVFVEFGEKRGLFAHGRPTTDDFRFGLAAVLAVEMPAARFEGNPHNSKVYDEELGLFIAADFSRFLTSYLAANESTGEAILKHAAESARYGRGESIQ